MPHDKCLLYWVKLSVYFITSQAQLLGGLGAVHLRGHSQQCWRLGRCTPLQPSLAVNEALGSVSSTVL